MGDEAETNQCPYLDPADPIKPCNYTRKSDTMLGVHNRAKQPKKDKAKVKIKDKVRNDTKMSKSIESKVVKFCKNESRKEFWRKKAEFQS